MDATLITRLESIAGDFGQIASKVNESSKLRKAHTENAIKLLESVENTGNILLKEIKFISKESILMRNRHNAVLNICKILLMNIRKQSEILKKFAEMKVISQKIIDSIKEKNLNLESSLEKGVAFLEKIVSRSNEMILMDNLIQTSKKFQNGRIQLLKKSTNIALKDSVKAIENSGANYERGLSLLKSLKEVEKFVENSEKDEIAVLAERASEGCKSAAIVNKSSKSQFEFAEEVNMYTKQLYTESQHIRELVVKKHKYFTDNLEPIAEVAVLVAVEFFDYLSVNDYIKEIDTDSKIYPDKVLEYLYDMVAYISSACVEIESVANLNYDMTESISLNARLEEKTVELTNHEIEGFDSLEIEVEKMTEATKYPVEGSEKNIQNGKEIEKVLKKIASSIR